MVYNVIGKLRIKNKLLCKKLKELIIKKNVTTEDLNMEKKINVRKILFIYILYLPFQLIK